jgi:threonyl-tRNA synthetase
MDDLDHRSIGNRQDLFHQQEEGPGMIFWHPRGWALWQTVENYIRARMRAAGYREIRTPQLLSRDLWRHSGHWDKFAHNMFCFDDGERSFALKPMSCPGHIQIFNQRLRSHRELPIRYAEFGACHRFEPSGSLQGLMRTRAFVQDDAHVLCREDQVEEEVGNFCRLLAAVYRDFGFADIDVAFSTRPEERAGDDALWDRAEAMLENAARAAGLAFSRQPGEGAFYGPKLEFILPDNRGRRWQCGTIQLDFVLPGRLGASYATGGNDRAVPVMIHHAVLGSLERFLAILLEHWDGRLPLWLAPDQVALLSLSDDVAPALNKAFDAFAGQGLRAVLDDGADSLSRKIAIAHGMGIPVMAVIGPRESRDGTVALRWPGNRTEVMSLAAAVATVADRARPPLLP